MTLECDHFRRSTQPSSRNLPLKNITPTNDSIMSAHQRFIRFMGGSKEILGEKKHEKKAPRMMHNVSIFMLCQVVGCVYLSECNVLMFILFVCFKHCCKCFMLKNLFDLI